MKKIIVSLLALVLIIGIIVSIYLFVKNQQIQESLKDVAQSEFVENGATETQNDIASEVVITRDNGVWSTSGTGEYTVDPESLNLTFTGYKVGGLHEGTFNSLTTMLALDEEGQPVAAVISIDPTTVQTDTKAVDEHLQDGVFFDTAQYPEILVAVRGLENKTGTSANAITDVTIKGITKTLSIPVTMTQTQEGTDFSLDTTIKVSEWDIAFGPVLDDARLAFSGSIVKK